MSKASDFKAAMDKRPWIQLKDKTIAQVNTEGSLELKDGIISDRSSVIILPESAIQLSEWITEIFGAGK